MTDKECVQDLKTLAEFFKEQSNGCVPVCLEYAIERLSEEGDEE